MNASMPCKPAIAHAVVGLLPNNLGLSQFLEIKAEAGVKRAGAAWPKSQVIIQGHKILIYGPLTPESHTCFTHSVD